MHIESVADALTWRDDGRLPIGTFVIHDRLEALIRSVSPHYLARLDIRILSRPLARLADLPREVRALKDAHVILAPGFLAGACGEKLCAPMIAIRPGLGDMLQALTVAGSFHAPLRILLDGQTFHQLDDACAVLKPGFAQSSYSDLEEVRGYISACAANAETVVVGDSVAVELAEKAGLRAVLVHTQSTIRSCLDTAIAAIQHRRHDSARQERLALLMRHLSDGILSIDERGRIVSINPAMAALIGIAPEAALGRLLAHTCAALAAAPITRHGEGNSAHVCRIRDRNILVHRFPLHETGHESGSTFVCRRPATAVAQPAYRHASHPHAARYHLEHVVGTSTAIRGVRLLAGQYANVDSTVLLTGESGTGKELFAQGIHNASRRRKGPFVAINCAALPETLLESELFGFEEGAFTGSRKGGKQGLFEVADGGTIFLDEIGDMPMPLQSRLLRVLQEREIVHIGGSEPIPIDIRIVAATNRDLQGDVVLGRFRSDLYFRLNVCRLHLPSLRERKEDIPALAQFILGRTLQKLGSARPAQDILAPVFAQIARYSWPGNIREMENVLERVAVYACGEAAEQLAAPLDADSLRLVVPEIFSAGAQAPPGKAMESALQQNLRASEAETILGMLTVHRGNRTRTARALGISRATLWRKLQRLPAPTTGK